MKKILAGIGSKAKETGLGVLIFLGTIYGQDITSSMDALRLGQEKILLKTEKLSEKCSQLDARIEKLEEIVF